MKVSGKVALVTGSSRGIGRAIAVSLAEQGANVVINYKIHEKEATETAREIGSLGSKTLVYRADVGDFDQTKLMIEKIVERFGKLDILVNNAGIVRDRTLLKMSLEEWNEVLRVNLTGVFNCIKHVIPHMMKQRKGKIVNISSVVGLLGNYGQTNYAASKAGIIGVTKSLAKELAKYNITVNAIAPGFIETSMLETVPNEIKNGILERLPLKRFGKQEEVANAVLFLIQNDYITGQVIVLDGGFSLVKT